MLNILSFLSVLIGISTVMLAASLVVMCVVRILMYLANMRGQTLGEMLGALNQSFRAEGGDTAEGADAPQLAFVHDILTFPALHAPERLAALAKPNTPAQQLEMRRANTANKVEYLAKQDLLEVVRTMLEKAPVQKDFDPTDGVLPARWFVHLSPKARTFSVFKAHVDQWYETLEGVSTEQFKLKARRMTATISCVVVVLLNLDALQLGSDIFDNSELQGLLADYAPVLLQRTDEMGASKPELPPTPERDALTTQVTETLQQVNGVLNEPSLALGWHGSKRVKAWCDGSEPRPGITLATLQWLAGLACSCVLLSLGAPFWSDMLKKLLSFDNSIKQAVAQRTASNGEPEPESKAKDKPQPR